MAEQVTTQDISTVKEQNSGNLISRAGNMFDKFQKFSNEPAIQRSIPVMVTLFVIFIGIIFFLLFTPIAVIMRLSWRDELRLRFKRKDSYWITREISMQSTSFKNQF